jgi:hypothetical protein
MGITADIKKYVDMNVSPHVKFPKMKTVVFDTFIYNFEKLYLKNGFRNIFIEKLVAD